MKLIIENPVVVITPSIGREALKQAVDSVRNQTYKNIKHLIVADGPEYFDKVTFMAYSGIESNEHIQVTKAPINTGANGFNGQRIYASYPHMVNEEYVFFLDEDNWWDENHVSSLVELIESEQLDWAHSLRKVYNNDQYLADDCCESIGRYPIWFTWPDNPQYLVDTSSYCFKRDFIKNTCHLWHSGVWGEDRRYFMAIKDTTKYSTTGLHTLNYRLPNMEKAYGGDTKFFEKGNNLIENIYGGKYPWLKR